MILRDCNVRCSPVFYRIDESFFSLCIDKIHELVYNILVTLTWKYEGDKYADLRRTRCQRTYRSGD